MPNNAFSGAKVRKSLDIRKFSLRKSLKFRVYPLKAKDIFLFFNKKFA